MKKYLINLVFVMALIAVSCDKDKDNVKPIIVDPIDSIKTDTTYSHPGHGSNLIGLSTSSFSDAHLTTTSLEKISPHFMRYYLGSTIVFDAASPPNGIASVTNFTYKRNDELSEHMAGNMNNWNYTPALDFDNLLHYVKLTMLNRLFFYQSMLPILLRKAQR